MNDQTTIASKYGIELADLVIELAAGDTGQDRLIDLYVEMLRRS